MKVTSHPLFRIAFSLFAPVSFVTKLFVLASDGSFVQPWGIFIALFIPVIIYITLASGDSPFFPALLLGGGILLFLLVTSTVFLYHPDFGKSLWHLVLIYNLIFLMNHERFLAGNTLLLKRIILLEQIFIALYLLWTIILGIVIATGRAYSPADALISNFYNAAMIILLIFLTMELRIVRTVVISNGTILLGDFNIGNFLPKTDVAILLELLSGRSVNCDHLRQTVLGEDADTLCADCRRHEGKPSACSTYRTLYNKILGIRRLLEAFGIGTIAGSLAGSSAVFPSHSDSPVHIRLVLESSVRVIRRDS